MMPESDGPSWTNVPVNHDYINDRIAEVSEAMADFPFSDAWLDDPEGMFKLVTYCKEKMRASGKARGPSLNSLNHLERVFISIEKGMPNSVTFRQAVDSAIGTEAVASTPRSIISMWKKISVSYFYPSGYERRTSPWVKLSPGSTEVWKTLHHIMRAKPLQDFAAKNKL